MPDISKINAVAVADIEKLDSILAANIEKVNGLTFPAAQAGSAAAYSVRLLDSLLGTTYTGAAMRVRRETAGGAGDDDEADIAFDTSLTDPTISLDSAISNASTGVTATTLGQFINVGTVNGTTYTNPDSLTVTASCFADEWKDQSGNANHASQSTFGSQPQIHSGTVDTDLILENGKPALSAAGNTSAGFMLINNTGWNINNLSCFFAGVNSTAPGTPPITLGAFADGAAWYQNWSGLVYYGTSSIGGTISRGSQTLTALIASTSQSTLYVRQDGSVNVSSSTVNAVVGSTTVGLGHLGGFYTDTGHKWQEVIVYASDQYNNISSIETDINGFFGIY